MSARTVELPALCRRAAVGTINEAKRTTELVFSTGAAVNRVDWSGTRYREVLSLVPAHVRLERLNAGAPLLNTHSAFHLADVVGTVEPGSASVDGRQGVATVRFSKRADVEPIWQDVKDRIVRNVSVGYVVHRFEETKAAGGAITRTAVLWEPFEISLVPMPADAGAQIRKGAETTPCVIVSASEADEEPVGALDGHPSRSARGAAFSDRTPLAESAPAQRGPSAAQWRAVREALEKFTGQGRWSGSAVCQVSFLPRFEIRWDDPGHYQNYPHAAAVTAAFANGHIVVCFRTDQTPEEIHRSALHECQHLLDHQFLNTMPRVWLEERARNTAERLARL